MSQQKDTSDSYLLQSVYEVPKHDTRPMRRSKKSRTSWKTIGVIVAALFAGLLFAVGHDLFNRSLNGREVDDVSVSQPWVSRIATAFAFLTQMSFAAAVAGSYNQRLWRNLRAGDYQLKHVDTLTAAQSNMFSLLKARVWVRVPVLFVMALTIWYGYLLLLQVIGVATQCVSHSSRQAHPSGGGHDTWYIDSDIPRTDEHH